MLDFIFPLFQLIQLVSRDRISVLWKFEADRLIGYENTADCPIWNFGWDFLYPPKILGVLTPKFHQIWILGDVTPKRHTTASLRVVWAINRQISPSSFCRRLVREKKWNKNKAFGIFFCGFSPYRGGAPSQPTVTIFGKFPQLMDTTKRANFCEVRFSRFEGTTGRNFIPPIG